MIQIAQAEYLLLLLLVPLLIVINIINIYIRKRKIKKLGDYTLLKHLMPRASIFRVWLKLILICFAIIFFAIGLSRPQLGARIKEVDGKGIEIMIAIDVSNSMLAQDYSPNRLERAKLAVSRLTDKLRNDRIGLIVFAGQAYVQLPVTTDYVSAKMFLNTISTNSVPIQGTSLASAIELAIKSFSAESANSGRAIILVTDGEDHEDDPVSVAKIAKDMGILVYTIGVGSVDGMPIPMDNGELLRDRNGQIVVTKLDEEILVKIAEAGGGVYTKASNSNFGLESIVDRIRELDSIQFRSVVFEDFNEQYMYFFGIALFFLLIELLVSDRKGRNFF